MQGLYRISNLFAENRHDLFLDKYFTLSSRRLSSFIALVFPILNLLNLIFNLILIFTLFEIL